MMNRGSFYFRFIYLVFVIGCSGSALISSWNVNDIIIDGSREEWGEKIHYVEEEKMAISVKNDNNYLYICLATSERSKMLKILQSGLTVWLDPLNSDGRTLGIKYPISQIRDPNEEMEMRKMQNNSREEFGIEKIFEKFKEKQNEILIVNEDNFPLSAISINNEVGVKVALGFEMKQLVYELRVPLANHEGSNILVDAIPGEEIEVTFESNEMKREEPQNRMGSMSGKGMKRNRRGEFRGGNQNRASNNKVMREPINFNINVMLSTKLQIN